MLSPNRSFQFVDGTLIIETDVAAGVTAYNPEAWPEIIVSMGDHSTEFRPNGLYGYDLFSGDWTLGCRLQPDRSPICSLMDNTERGPLEGGRLWEMSWFQHGVLQRFINFWAVRCTRGGI